MGADAERDRWIQDLVNSAHGCHPSASRDQLEVLELELELLEGVPQLRP